MRQQDRNRQIEHVLIIAGVMLLLFTSPLTDWWARSGLGWLLPYGLWAVVILASALASIRRRKDEP